MISPEASASAVVSLVVSLNVDFAISIFYFLSMLLFICRIVFYILDKLNFWTSLNKDSGHDLLQPEGRQPLPD